MPKIVVPTYEPDTTGDSKATHQTTNQQKLQQWFATESNWEKLSEQLTKKLGSSKFKNVVLTSPMVSYEDTSSNTRVPKVTFTLQGKEGYELQTTDGASATLSLSIRVLYTSESSTQNVLRYQGASSSAAPSGSTPSNNAAVIRDVNVYMNYTGPALILNAALPTVGNAANTSLNETSNVTDEDFNAAFRGLLFTDRYVNPLMQSVINYVNKFDPKYKAAFVTEKNGVALTSVQSGTQLRIGSLNDFLYNNKGFLQQVNTDTKAVYFAVNGVTSQGWLNTFLIRIPLTKFVKPLSVLQAATDSSQNAEQTGETQGSQPEAQSQ
ncbi:hypothetical protein [Mycoplasmopsis synoviae]|uniref:Putative phase-variable hemagglutinin n=1 Tax=Mycoplasmopsis synoviae (strain 53) TaxID=262723 RepID=Q4A6J7_MYCS5|nr:hypothetical protein [Mycoplasmopsis synoviae]AAZ43624.2 putative phase-variable hemagglutinin [Mycoplasmopsis synoviae 53]